MLAYRVALARAVYAPTSCLLLDDPLSAVVRSLTPILGDPSLNPLQDSHTAQFLVDRLFQGSLMAKRTVVCFPLRKTEQI